MRELVGAVVVASVVRIVERAWLARGMVGNGMTLVCLTGEAIQGAGLDA